MAEGRKAGETTGPEITKNYTVRDALAGQSVALVDFCTISNAKILIVLRTWGWVRLFISSCSFVRCRPWRLGG
jgi:hypothetical protein